MKSLLAALIGLVLSVEVIAQGVRLPPTTTGSANLGPAVTGHGPAGIPITPSLSNSTQTYTPAPSLSVAPLPTIAPSSRAASANAIIGTAAAQRVFAYRRSTLTGITPVAAWENGNYSARAYFTIQGQTVALRCISTVRAVVAAFLDYVKRLSYSDSTTDSSLDAIVAGARRDIANRTGASRSEITLIYIDQFSETHVVRLSLDESGVALAGR